MSNQTQQPCQPLTVTLHDSNDQAIAGAAVQLRVGDELRGTGALDASGVAELCAPAGAVRVAISGQLPSGAPLSLPGQDAGGILLRIGDAPARLDLRAEEDGTVLPDPATMWAREPGPPVATEAAAMPAATLPALQILPPATPTASVAVVTPDAVPSRTPPGAPADLLVSGALLILALLLVGGWWLWERRAA